MNITKTAFLDWKRDPVTKKLFSLLDEIRSVKQKEFLRAHSTVDATALHTARLQGLMDALNFIEDAELNDEDEENNDVRRDDE